MNAFPVMSRSAHLFGLADDAEHSNAPSWEGGRVAGTIWETLLPRGLPVATVDFAGVAEARQLR